jgi:hypothetical protein
MPVKRATRKPKRQDEAIKASAKSGGKSKVRAKEISARPVPKSKSKSKRSGKSKAR